MNFRSLSPLLFIIIIVPLLYCCTKAESSSKDDLHLNHSYEPIPLGDIKPGGWLKDWAIRAKDGITGQLDERATTYAMAWSGEPFEARGAREDGTGWPLEQCAYWLDGLVKLAYILDDSVLISKAKSRLDPVVEGVLAGGETFIYWKPLNQLDDRFDNWAHSHMGRALVAYYSATGDTRILEALVRVYRNYYYPEMIPPSFGRVNGVVNMDPILESYYYSHDSTILKASRELLVRKDFKRLVRMWNQDSLREGHTVIFYENSRVPALAYSLKGDPEYLSATIRALDWAERKHQLPVGLVSGEEWMSGIGSTRNVETCNVAAGGWTYSWLLRVTGEGTYADRIEKIFFNAGPVPLSRDFQTMSYYQSPNKLSGDLPRDEPNNPGPGSYSYTALGHEVLCCIGNSNRIIPNYISHMWMKTKDNGLVAALYGPCELKTEINGNPVTIHSETIYPFEEKIKMTVGVEEKTRFTLHLRIPEWCKEHSITINGSPFTNPENHNGFLAVNRNWKQGDIIDLHFPMDVTLTLGRETNFPDVSYFKGKETSREISRSTEEIANPYGTVSLGPLLFALPIPDSGANYPIQWTDIGYALNMDPDLPGEKVKIESAALKRPWKWEYGESPLSLTVPVLQFDWDPTPLQSLPRDPVTEGEETSIKLIPYNLTKFRVSMFPVAAATWEKPRNQ